MALTTHSPRVDLSFCREDFPILREKVNGKPLVYLDSAATAQKPQAVITSLDEYWLTVNANVHRGVHYLSSKATKLFDDARETVRGFMNAEHEQEIVFTKGCTEGINLVATGLERIARGASSTGTFAGESSLLPKIGEGDVILLSEMEHHSNIVPWQMLAQQTGARVIPIPVTDLGEIDLDAYARLLKQNSVRVLGIVHISNAIGTINPVKQMARMAHDVGALVVVDGAQAGPHWLVDVRDLDADFYTLSCHKMYAPTGIGVLYGKKHLLAALPAYQGGGSMIRTVSFEEGTTYADIPAKFEPGTPNIAGVVGLGAAIEYLEALGAQISELGTVPDTNRQSPIANSRTPNAERRTPLATAMSAIHAHELELATYAQELLEAIPGVRVIGKAPEKAGIVSFVMEQAHPHDVGTILDNEGIAVRAGHHCCMPLMKRMGVPATARASFALYNTRAEVEALAAGVRNVVEVFA